MSSPGTGMLHADSKVKTLTVASEEQRDSMAEPVRKNYVIRNEF